MAFSSSETESSSVVLPIGQRLALRSGRSAYSRGPIRDLDSAVSIQQTMNALDRPIRLPVVLALAAAAVTLSACGPVKRPDGGSGLLPVGAPAPDFAGRDATGKPVRLSEQRGHAAVVYFYPKDGTPGCTTEACAFRDAWKRYEARGV